MMRVVQNSISEPVPGGDRAVAFTLVELLVVIAVLGVLAGLLLPALARSKSKAQGVFCLNNTRQLGLAWLMYADDHAGRLPYNLGGVGGRGVARQKAPLNWVNGVLDWELTSDNTNTALITGGSLAAYANNTVAIYRCPADGVLSEIQRRAGWSARTRSYSMNAMVGDAGPASQEGYNANNPGYQQFFSLSAIPRPGGIFVFLDEHPDSIDDGYFVNNSDDWKWTDLPASYHNGAASFSFADGHSEGHRWRDPSTQPPARPDAATLPLPIPSGQSEDFEWVVERMSLERPDVVTSGSSVH